uniref:ATP synthase F0 subunit 8 n=1 Tax=Harpochytrium sp. JEL105 TaxID=224131 RepID=Q85ME0_9FUNG|nr:ATP synthase F0 subunit 8 [Harpochytrium sp. JEL105]AAO64942.1 ATP synthase F0 subunit 8 [Harpochytrium sp. JEL105]
MPQLMPMNYLNLLSWFSILFVLFMVFNQVLVFPYILLTHLSRYTLLFI